MDESMIVSERQEDGSYRVHRHGEPPSGTIIWGTYRYWARRHSCWTHRFRLKEVLKQIEPLLVSVEEGGCSFYLHPEGVAEKAIQRLKAELGG